MIYLYYNFVNLTWIWWTYTPSKLFHYTQSNTDTSCIWILCGNVLQFITLYIPHYSTRNQELSLFDEYFIIKCLFTNQCIRARSFKLQYVHNLDLCTLPNTHTIQTQYEYPPATGTNWTYLYYLYSLKFYCGVLVGNTNFKL